MRQLFIAGNVAYTTAATDTKDLTKLEAGAIGIFDNTGKVLKAALSTVKDYVTIALGRGANLPPLIMDEVNLASLSVVKGEYQAATKFTAKITVPTPTADKDYTVIVVKKGVQFNERNKWTSTVRAKEGDTAETVAAALVKLVKAKMATCGVDASNTAGAITFTAVNSGEDYTVVGADELLGIALTAVTQGQPAYGDSAYIKDLASQAAAGKGFEYTDPSDVNIYPGYPEKVDAASYTIYTLRFANPRKVKTRDEVVNQILQIAVPTGAGQITTLDTIFGTGE